MLIVRKALKENRPEGNTEKRTGIISKRGSKKDLKSNRYLHIVAIQC